MWSPAQARATWLGVRDVEKLSGFSGEVGGGDPQGQLGKEPNPGQLVGDYQETEKRK